MNETGFIKIAFAIKVKADNQQEAEIIGDELIELCKDIINKETECEVTETLIDACDFESNNEEYEGFL